MISIPKIFIESRIKNRFCSKVFPPGKFITKQTNKFDISFRWKVIYFFSIFYIWIELNKSLHLSSTTIFLLLLLLQYIDSNIFNTRITQFISFLGEKKTSWKVIFSLPGFIWFMFYLEITDNSITWLV